MLTLMGDTYQSPHLCLYLKLLVTAVQPQRSIFLISSLIDSFYEKKIASLSTIQFKNLNVKE